MTDASLDPGGIARRQFATVRKGLDPNEVRAYLEQLAAQVAALQRSEAEQREATAQAEDRVKAAENLDDHRLVEILGEETTRVLESAREAASDIRRKAEESAARLISEANDEAHRVRAEAESQVAAQRLEMMAEVEALQREAAGELEYRRAEASQVVAEMQREAQKECDTLRAEAQREGQQLVEEALVVRERMLRDLARRRRSAREQLERLNAARERLLAAHEVVRRTVDEATAELTVALPEARLAGEAAMRRVHDEREPTVEELDELVHMARIAGLVDVSSESDGSSADEVLDQEERDPAELVESADLGELGDEGSEAEDETPYIEVSATSVDSEPDQELVDEPDVEVEAEAEPGELDAEDLVPEIEATVDQDEVTAEPESETGWDEPEPEAEPVDAEPEPEQAEVDESEAERTEPELVDFGSDDDVEADPEPVLANGSSVDELFARLRAGAAEQPEPVVLEPAADNDTADAAVAADDYDEDEDSQTADEPEPEPVSAKRDRPSVDDLVSTVAVESGGAALLAQRDEFLSSLEGDVARRLKLVLADEQNEVLDKLRRGKAPTGIDDLLPQLGPHAARYAEAARDELAMVADLGAEAVGGEADGTGDALAAELAQATVEPLRERISGCIDDSTDDVDEITRRLRALYREWKGQRIAEGVRHFTAAAYAHGAYAGAPDGAPLCWLVDGSGPPCADADDNALAGSVRKGEPFPTGDHCPPAHLGCRCLVVPVEVALAAANETVDADDEAVDTAAPAAS